MRARRTARLLLAVLALLAPFALVSSPASAAAAAPRYERLVTKQVNQVRVAEGLPRMLRRTGAASCYDAVAERWAARIHRTGHVVKLPVRRVARQCPGRVLQTVAARTKSSPRELVDRVVSATTALPGDDRVRHLGVGARRGRDGIWSVVLVIGDGPRGSAPSVPAPAPAPGTTEPAPEPAPAPKPDTAPQPEPAPVPAPAPAPAQPGTVAERVRGEIFTATNAERTSRSLGALRRQACLDELAQRHAERMASTGSFAHQDLRPILSSCSLRSVAENIAYNHTTTGTSHVNQWMNSSGHRANLLNPRYTMIGIGAARTASGRMYTVQVFGS